MTTAAVAVTPIAWWKEPTKDQWYAYVAAWAGWTLDAFDFTAFLLIIAPIAKEFDVPVTEVTAVLTVTLWMRLLGATANGWLADRIGRKTPLMISIIWYSVCNFMPGWHRVSLYSFCSGLFSALEIGQLRLAAARRGIRRAVLRNAVISFKLLTRPRKVPFTADGIIDCSAPITVIPATAIEPSSSALKETFVRARGQGSHWSAATSPHRILDYATTSVGLRVTAWDTL